MCIIDRKGENFMENKKTPFFINFIIRAILGMGLIFFANQYLDYRNIEVSVGLNLISFLTSGMLGIPGVGLLYGIMFYKIM